MQAESIIHGIHVSQIKKVGNSLYAIIQDELGRYLRHLYRLNYGTKLTSPSRGMHITLDTNCQTFDSWPNVDFVIINYDENEKVVWANVIFMSQVPSSRKSFHFAVGYK